MIVEPTRTLDEGLAKRRPPGGTSEALAALDPAAALARANLYRYLSVAVLPPDDERFGLLHDPGFRQVVAAAVGWLRDDDAFHPESLGPGELAPAELCADDLFPRGAEIGDAYVRTFGHSVSKDCPPYETEYCANRDVTYRSQRLADIAGFYRAFGLDRAEGARDRVDHLSFEAEFMEIVIARQLFARERALGDEKVELCRSAQRRFFVEHLGWWLPAFGSRLQGRGTTAFYGAIGGLARGLAAAERALLGLPPFTELPTARPDDYEPEGACFSCGLADQGGPGAAGEVAAGHAAPGIELPVLR